MSLTKSAMSSEFENDQSQTETAHDGDRKTKAFFSIAADEVFFSSKVLFGA